MWLSCKVIKKWQPPPISTSTSFFRFIPPFLQNILYPPPPPSDSIFRRSYLPFNMGVVPTMKNQIYSSVFTDGFMVFVNIDKFISMVILVLKLLFWGFKFVNHVIMYVFEQIILFVPILLQWINVSVNVFWCTLLQDILGNILNIKYIKIIFVFKLCIIV